MSWSMNMSYSATYDRSVQPAAVDAACFHCGDPVSAGSELSVRIKGHARPVCCLGCQAVAEWIETSGLGAFYEHRIETSPRPDAGAKGKWRGYDDPETQRSLIIREGDSAGIRLWVDGLRCAACAWLIEKGLQQFTAVQSIDVNAVTGAVYLRWRIKQTPLSVLLARIESLGYTPYPAGGDRERAPVVDRRRRQLKGLFVAAVGMAQVMTFAIALYIGETQAMQALYRDYFKWISLLVTLPVVFYSAAPFFRGAWEGLRHGLMNIDMPVSLAIAGAFILSAWNTVTGEGAVYFDSIVMFVFFILLGRYLQSYVRSRMGRLLHLLAAAGNRPVCRLRDDFEEYVPAGEIRVGDRLRIKADETFPVDAMIESGAGLVDESLLTGESTPLRKSAGEAVAGGSINLGQTLDIRATAVGEATLIARIRKMAWLAQTRKPAFAATLDRLASRFVAGVVILSIISALVWWRIDPERIADIMLAILIAACPCALALAVPAALTAASARLAAAGVWLVRSEALETLADVDYVVFDKTGTLTEGRCSVASIRTWRDVTEQQALQYAAALESHSNHPYADAFIRAAGKLNQGAADVCTREHCGLYGKIGDTWYRIGTRDFVVAAANTHQPPEMAEPADPEGHVWLGDDAGLIASFNIVDVPREDASFLAGELARRGFEVEILSGDHEIRVREVAGRLGIARYRSRQSSADKTGRINELQAAGGKVLMVGDGANDTPVLSAADVSIAVNGGSALAQAASDLLLTGSRLAPLLETLDVAARARRVIRQNIVWALLYNLSVLPLAVCGVLQPWVAAVGMPASSLLVILNAMRVQRS